MHCTVEIQVPITHSWTAHFVCKGEMKAGQFLT